MFYDRLGSPDTTHGESARIGSLRYLAGVSDHPLTVAPPLHGIFPFIVRKVFLATAMLLNDMEKCHGDKIHDRTSRDFGCWHTID